MANKTFVSNGTFTVADNDAVAFGASVAGTEIVKILSGVTGVKLDANFEQIVLSGNLNTYKFLVVSGTGLQILATDGTTVIATIPNLNQVVKLVFADGFTSLTQTGSMAFKLGASSTVSTLTAGVLTPTLSTGYTVSEFASAAGGIAVSENIIVSDTASTISTDLASGASSVLLTNIAKIDYFTLSAGTASAADLKAIEAATTGLVTATAITDITSSSVADVKSVLVTTEGTTGDKMDMAASVTVALSDASAAAADLNAIDAKTTGVVTGAAIAAITSSLVADVKTLLVTNTGTTVVAANATVALSDTSAAAADLNAIDAKTTGVVTGAAIAAITSSLVADVKTLLVTNTGTTVIKSDATVALSDTSAAAADLNAIDAKTTGVVTGAAIAAITSSLVADVKTLLVTNTGTTVIKSDATVALSDTSAAAADLNAIDAKTTGVVTGAAIAAITSSLVADVKTLLVTNAATTVTKANPTVVLSDVGSDADTDAILGATTGAVTTGQLIAGTYANFASDDKIATGLTFGTHTSTASVDDTSLTWLFNDGTLTYESADDAGAPTTVQLVLTGVTAVAEVGGVFTLTV